MSGYFPRRNELIQLRARSVGRYNHALRGIFKLDEEYPYEQPYAKYG